jgi:hypothetical protein
VGGLTGSRRPRREARSAIAYRLGLCVRSADGVPCPDSRTSVP